MALFKVKDESTGQYHKIEMTPDEANRFKIDINFARAKLQEAKDALIAQKLEDEAFIVSEEHESFDNLADNEDTVEPLEPIQEDAILLKWSREAILLLIEEYRTKDFTSGKPQKKIWEAIASKLIESGHDVTGPQCLSKLNGLKRTYESVKDHNGKSGNNPRIWPYFKIMDELIGKKPFMEPVSTISSTGKRSERESECSKENTPKKSKQSAQVSNKEIISELQKFKREAEENRERRHREKIEQKNKSLAVMEKLVAALNK